MVEPLFETLMFGVSFLDELGCCTTVSNQGIIMTDARIFSPNKQRIFYYGVPILMCTYYVLRIQSVAFPYKGLIDRQMYIFLIPSTVVVTFSNTLFHLIYVAKKNGTKSLKKELFSLIRCHSFIIKDSITFAADSLYLFITTTKENLFFRYTASHQPFFWFNLMPKEKWKSQQCQTNIAFMNF